MLGGLLLLQIEIDSGDAFQWRVILNSSVTNEAVLQQAVLVNSQATHMLIRNFGFHDFLGEGVQLIDCKGSGRS